MPKQRPIQKPLLEGPKKASTWIAVPPRTGRSFIERWLSALSENPKQHEQMSEFDSFWERDCALVDLRLRTSPFSQPLTKSIGNVKNRKRVADSAPMLLEPNVDFQEFLWRELRLYALHLNRVVEINRNLETISDQLRSTHSLTFRLANRSRLKVSLDPLLDELLELSRRFDEFGETYWKKIYCSGALASRPRDPDVEEILDVNTHLEPHAVSLAVRQLSGHISLPDLRQERNLDTVFQVRVGDLLRQYTTDAYGRRRPGLLTISRLVLLVYICAGLTESDLTIWRSNPPRVLSVEKTYEKLRDADLR